MMMKRNVPNSMLMRLFLVVVLMSTSLVLFAETGESFEIDGKASIQSGFYTYEDVESGSVSFQTAYAGDMKAKVTLLEGGRASILLENVRYTNPLLAVQDRYLGNILFEVDIDSNGTIGEQECEVSFSEGSIDGVNTWDDSQCYNPYPIIVTGFLTPDHHLSLNIILELYYTDFYPPGDFWLSISFGEALPPYEYKRQVTAGEYGTIVLPFKPSEMNGIDKFYSIAGKRQDAGSGAYHLILQEEETMEAGVPYIFRSNDTEIEFSAPGDAERACLPVNLQLDYMEDYGFSYKFSESGLQGTFLALQVSSIGYWDSYIDEWLEESFDFFYNYAVYSIVGNGYQYERGIIDAFQAFVLMEYVPVFSGDLEDSNVILYSNEVTTGLTPMVRKSSPTGKYNLSGQRISKPQKGISIIDGKKVVR